MIRSVFFVEVVGRIAVFNPALIVDMSLQTFFVLSHRAHRVLRISFTLSHRAFLSLRTSFILSHRARRVLRTSFVKQSKLLADLDSLRQQDHAYYPRSVVNLSYRLIANILDCFVPTLYASSRNDKKM